MKDNDVFLAMIDEELTQYKYFFLYKEKQMLKKGEYRELIRSSMKRVRFYKYSVIVFILIGSMVTLYSFIVYSLGGEWTIMLQGLYNLALVIFISYIYFNNVLPMSKTMERVLKLLDAREEYYQNQNK